MPRNARGQVVPLDRGAGRVAGLVILGLGHLAGAARNGRWPGGRLTPLPLAGAAEGRAAAEQMAAANGARMTRYRETASEAEVVVAYRPRPCHCEGESDKAAGGRCGRATRSGAARCLGAGGAAARSQAGSGANRAVAASSSPPLRWPSSRQSQRKPACARRRRALARSAAADSVSADAARPRDVVVRSVDTRSVLRVSAVFYVCLLLVVIVAWTILWTVAAVAGVTGNVEEFIANLFALDSFRFSVLSQVQAALVGGAVWVALGTGLNVLGAIFFNLISELVGGIRVRVDDEEDPRRAALV